MYLDDKAFQQASRDTEGDASQGIRKRKRNEAQRGISKVGVYMAEEKVDK